MTEAEARRLVGLLVAAFPSPIPPEATVALYVEHVAGLRDVAAASEAVEGLLRSARAWPPLASILAGYQTIERRHRERAERAGLPSDPDRQIHARTALDALPTEGGPLLAGLHVELARIAGVPPRAVLLAPVEDEPELDAGRCADCRRRVKARRRYGQACQEDGGIGLALCRRCYRSRERVARDFVERKATADPAPRPDPEAGSATMRSAPRSGRRAS
jgi:hypothetical protein